MEAKLSSSRIMSAACLDTSEPAIPMATPISAFESGGIIDTITGDSHDSAHPLATLNNDQLLLGRGPGEYNLSVVHQDLVNLLLAHVLDLSTVNDSGLGLSGVDILDLDSLPGGNILNGFGSLRDDSDRSCDGSGSDGMVTSDHDDFDSG